MAAYCSKSKAIRELGPFENLLLVTGENPRVAGTDYLEEALRVCRPYFQELVIYSGMYIPMVRPKRICVSSRLRSAICSRYGAAAGDTGENPRVAGTDYLEEALRVCRPYFSNLTIEVMPLPAEDYRRLTGSGLNGVVCFQETYHREKYKTYHPAGIAECEGELGQFAVAHHDVGLEMAFRRTHTREIDAVACAPVVFAEVEQVACHHCHIGAPVLKTYQHSHADFVHSGLSHAVESVDTPFKVRFHSCRVVCFVLLAASPTS